MKILPNLHEISLDNSHSVVGCEFFIVSTTLEHGNDE